METLEDQRDLIYLGVGPLAAILTGLALVPLRDFTSASNFTFIFMALIILAAAVVRDERNHLVAASDQAWSHPVPERALQPDTLLPSEAARDLLRSSAPFPGDGSRLALVAGNRQVGWLDVLSDVGRLIAVRLTGLAGAPGSARG